MTQLPSEVRTLGQRIAYYRRQIGVSQKELAHTVDRSESWVSHVERDTQDIQRLALLQKTADALGVSIQDLRPEVAPKDEPHVPLRQSLDELRIAVTNPPSLLDLTTDKDSLVIDLQAASAQVRKLWFEVHRNDFLGMNERMPNVIQHLERSARHASRATRPKLYAVLASAYQACAATFARHDEPDAAWLTSDRAIAAAEASGESLEVFAGTYRMAHAFIRLGRLDQAEAVTDLAIQALEPQTHEREVKPEVLSLFGALHLVQATIYSRENDRANAHRCLDVARDVASQIGSDRNDFHTEFGPTNVELHAVTAAVDLGDAGHALDIASAIDASHLSPERQARFLLDVARAHAQRRQVGEATRALLKAEQLAYEQVHSHPLGRDTIRDLFHLSGNKVSEELRLLADRAVLTT